MERSLFRRAELAGQHRHGEHQKADHRQAGDARPGHRGRPVVPRLPVGAIVVPAGHDPYPILEAVQKQIEEATAESAREAEAQWREARRSPHLGALTVAPSIHLRPIAGGVEIIARYITDVAQREELKAKLYYTAVNLLGGMSARATASIP